MQLSFQYGTKTIIFNASYRERKTMEISVEPPDIVNVISPLGASEEQVLTKVRSKARWITQKLYAMKDMAYIPIKRETVNGESFMYLGRNYSLQIHLDQSVGKPQVDLFQGKFRVISSINDEQMIHHAMEEWYRKKALEKVQERVKFYESKFHQKASQIIVKEQQKRWASCTSKNVLLFNWKCVMAPSPVLDYIVVHEMVHLFEKNHSQRFWDMLASILPDYERRKEWLKNNGIKMDI